MIRRLSILALLVLGALAWGAPASIAEAENCDTDPRPECFGVESVNVTLSTTQAGAHPELGLDIAAKLNPKSPTNAFGAHDSYAAVRDARFTLPLGLVGDPNAIGVVQQCSAEQLVSYNEKNGGCPNGSQIGVADIAAYVLTRPFHEPVYMMKPPGGDVVARVGLIAGLYPTFIDFRVRSESDYALVSEIVNAPAIARVISLESTFWGVPASPTHNTERCTPAEVFGSNCQSSPSRPPGSNELPLFTNPTRCGVPLHFGVNATSWVEPQFDPEKEVQGEVPEITGCNKLPFGPGLEMEPTSHHTSSPTGLDMDFKLPASPGVKVLEPSQTRYIRIDLPVGFSVNTDSADGLETCSPTQVRFGENAPSECPNGSKMAATEFDIPVLERKLKGSIYLREPEPGHPYRLWVVADDLGLHVKLPGELEIDRQTGQVHSVVMGVSALGGIPQAPVRELRLLFKPGFRAPLTTPSRCDGDPSTPERDPYYASYEFIPWSGAPPAVGKAPMEITEGCSDGGFAPKLQAGSTDSRGGAFSPFNLTLTREDSEADIGGFALTLPRGMAASFKGLPQCIGAAAETGNCPAASQIGKVVAAVGVGPNPLWIPQPDKRPTAIYLGGPYKGAPTSIVAVVPKQAGPFDFGDEVVRSAISVDRVTGQATTTTDPLPQFVEGVPVHYRTVSVQLGGNFVLNPTSCTRKESIGSFSSTDGMSATATDSFAATGCSGLGFSPKLSVRLLGGTHRGSFPALRATLKMPQGGANIGSSVVVLPHSEFVENSHFVNICTKVQFAAHECPAGSVYGFAKATTPLFDGALEGPVYLRSTTEPEKYVLPDVVVALKGPPSLPVEIDLIGHVDSEIRHTKNGETASLLRTTFNSVPDAPVSEFTLALQGGKKGLFVNSKPLCKHVHRAKAAFTGQNGRSITLHPALKVSCR